MLVPIALGTECRATKDCMEGKNNERGRLAATYHSAIDHGSDESAIMNTKKLLTRIETLIKVACLPYLSIMWPNKI